MGALGGSGSLRILRGCGPSPPLTTHVRLGLVEDEWDWLKYGQKKLLNDYGGITKNGVKEIRLCKGDHVVRHYFKVTQPYPPLCTPPLLLSHMHM